MRNTDRGCVNAIEAPAAGPRHVQAPGFERVRVGDLLVTALYDGFVAIVADDFRGEPPAEVSRWLAEAFIPPDGDRRTAVIAFLVEDHGRRILIDAGSGDSLGPDTGYLPRNLATAQTGPAEVDHVLITHLHPDHAGGLIYPDGLAVFPHATVHAATADADHWLDPARAAAATGVQRLVHDTAARAVAPYRDTGRFATFGDADEVIPGVRTLNLAGHSPGHTGYLFGEGEETILFGVTPCTATRCSCEARRSRPAPRAMRRRRLARVARP